VRLGTANQLLDTKMVEERKRVPTTGGFFERRDEPVSITDALAVQCDHWGAWFGMEPVNRLTKIGRMDK